MNPVDRSPTHGADPPSGTRSRELVADLLTHAPVGLGILDPQHRFLSLNDELATLGGRRAREHVGHTVEETMGRLAGTLAPVVERVTPERGLVEQEIAAYDWRHEGGGSWVLARCFPMG